MTFLDLPSGLDLVALRALAADKAQRAASAQEERPDGLVPAISYLRVSTKDQATRNGLEEGLSIPAQREAAQRKAEQLDAVIVKEFIEPGESAKTARRRALQEMLDYIAANPVRYCIINKVDRLARNRLDDAIIHSTLRGANITLVSVTENIDETPSGMLMHGILASMAEFYSLNLAQEVLKGMAQKASIGGTPTKAPLGYLNVRTTDAKGREVRDVELDPDRADLLRFAFTAYATGDWSLSSLARELKTRGLTTRPTPSRPAKPVTTTGLHKILTNPYYQGTVTFRGITYDGAHTPLVDPNTWLRVQTQLDAKNAVGERPQKYDHYLKGSVCCSCGAKLMIERPRDKQGDRYEYFTCSGRRKKNGCTRSAVLAERIEDRIERDYGTNGLTAEEAERVSQVLHQVFDQLEAASDDERAVLTAQRDKLEAERLKLVQAHYADAIPLDLLKTASAPAWTRSPTASTVSRPPTRALTRGSIRSSVSSPTSVTSTASANLLNAASSTVRCSSGSSSTRTNTSRSYLPNRRPPSSPRHTGPRRPNRTQRRTCPAIRRGRFRTSQLTWTSVESSRTPARP